MLRVSQPAASRLSFRAIRRQLEHLLYLPVDTAKRLGHVRVDGALVVRSSAI